METGMSDKLRISSRANSVQNIQDEMDWTHVHDAVRGIFGCNIRRHGASSPLGFGLSVDSMPIQMMYLDVILTSYAALT